VCANYTTARSINQISQIYTRNWAREPMNVVINWPLPADVYEFII